MKNLNLIVIITLLFSISFPSCHNERKKDAEKTADFDFYSITLLQQDNSQLYLRLKNLNDSLFILVDRDSTKRIEKKIFLTKEESNSFKNVVIENLSVKMYPIDTTVIFGGVDVKFYVEKNNWNLSSRYNQLEGFYSISKEFADYLEELHTKIPEIFIYNSKSQMDSLKGLLN